MLALAGLTALIICLRGLTLIFDHSLNSIDGALQTWFALDNFAHGEQLGVQFQSYLGITMIAALLPVYLVAGQTLFASTLAANSMVVAGAFASGWAIAWMIRCVPAHHRWGGAILIVFIFYYVGSLSGNAIGLPYPATLDPGVSLRPLRGFLPFLVLPLFVLLLRRILREQSAAAAVWLGLIAGVGLLWSNDAGIPLVLALALGLVMALHHRIFLLVKTLGLFAAGTAASAGAVLMLVTQGKPAGWLQYNFSDVAGDQFWFFAPWDRSTRILSLTDLPNILLHGELLSTASLMLLIGCVLWAMVARLRKRGSPVRGSAFVFVGASVIGTALIPQIGGHIGAEYNATTFVLGICAPLIIGQRAVLRWAKPVLRNAFPAKTAVGIGVAVCVAALAMAGIEAGRFVSVWANTDRTTYDAALGFHVTPEYAADLAAMRQLARGWDAQGIPQDRRLLSVYTSPLDIAAGVESPQPVGSLIHALGSQNRTAYSALVAEQQVAAVTTIASDYSGWEGWITRANWPFFESLRTQYRPMARTDQNVLWLPSRSGGPIGVARCAVAPLSASKLRVTITGAQEGTASVRIERSGAYATGRSAVLTVTENSPYTRAASAPAWSDFPRYGVANDRIVSVPAPVEFGELTDLTLEVLDGSAIGAAECSAQVFPPIDFASLPSLAAGVDAYLAQVGK